MSQYEGGEGGNAQLQYFKSECNQGYYDKDSEREPAEKADILALGNLAVKQPEKVEEPELIDKDQIDETMLMPDY